MKKITRKKASVKGRVKGPLGSNEVDYDNPPEVEVREPCAYVKVGKGVTRSAGEDTFEYNRLDVEVTLPCNVDDVESGFKQADGLAEDFLIEMMEEWEIDTEVF